jgi:DNA-binding CsgD family transcriptional regulator/transcriptional regulator with GAF, ATPase, and Fis domain
MKSEITRRGSSAAHRRGLSRQKLQQRVAELAAHQAVIWEVLRAIASSPHDLQPICQTIIDSAMRLCRAEAGSFRLVEEAGLRLAAYKWSPASLPRYSPPMLLDHGSFLGRHSKSRVHIPDIAAVEVYSAVEVDRVAAVKAGFRTALLVPMLRNDELVGAFSIGRRRIEHFTENEIQLVTDFAAQAAIALEITRRERQLRELQRGLGQVNRVATIKHLTASITHEVNQPLAGACNNLTADLNFVDRTQPSSRVSDPLSAREHDVLTMISQGLSNKRVARALEISPETVKSHVKNIFLKLEVSTRAEAVFQASKL